MTKSELISAVLAAFSLAAYRHPIGCRVVGWTHVQSGQTLGAGSSFPWPGDYEPRHRWTRIGDGGTTLGKTFATREEIEADQDAHAARQVGRFRETLEGMTPKEIRAQLAFWEGEAAKVAARAA